MTSAEDLGAQLIEPAVTLVERWLAAASDQDRPERRLNDRFRELTGDTASVQFTMSFCDRVLRPESALVAADQLRALVRGPLPRFLSRGDRLLLRVGASLSTYAPTIVLPLARWRLRRLVGGLVVDAEDPALARHLRRLEGAGYRTNLNLLGESVLGEDQARRHRTATVALLGRPDVDYVSVKASSVTSQLNLWGYEDSLRRVTADLGEVLRAAATGQPPKFVNLDMEEYKDLRLTIEAFTHLLQAPDLLHLDAGIVLQAYLPDAFEALQELVSWAAHRQAQGGAAIKIRIVKGANLAMERVDAAVHGWAQAPYPTKAETDANYKRMLDWAFDPARLSAVRIGVASHNLFDVAWAHLLAEARHVGHRVEFEMLQGMAPGTARTVRQATGQLLLYTPVVSAADFDNAVAYLFRRLEENSAGDNFLHHSFDLARDKSAFDTQRARFEAAVARRWEVSSAPRRRPPAVPPPGTFANTADTDPTDPLARAAILAALAEPPVMVEADTADCAGIDRVLARARQAAARWRDLPAVERRALLHDAGVQLEARRAQLIALMAEEGGKALPEGDTEVSEAVDFAHYYAEQVVSLGSLEGLVFAPLGVVAVIPPWNFPVAIPAGGTLAALAAGNTVILKPAPQTPRCAQLVAEACWSAGIPRDVLQYVRAPDTPAGAHLVAHHDLDGIILTGSTETAELFHRLAPTTPLFAETSGKNAIVVMPDADLDLAVADVVHSAFSHAGQKCSAASLAICVGDVATSERFRRQLADATRSLVVGPARRPETVVGPLIETPSAALHRALSELDPGQRWLVRPRLLDPATNLWSPGILEGVEPGSWFHHTECFGPVLGLMAARDLDQALSFQNGTGSGLTAGLHTLSPQHQAQWLARVEAGNAYINRGTTGAVVQRQPFGGWKRSVVGPGAKAGGPNYLLQLGTWRDEERTSIDHDASYHDWWAREFSTEHDPTGLFCESNILRYRPLPALQVRIAADAEADHVERVLAAVAVAGLRPQLSFDPSRGPLAPPGALLEASAAFARRMSVGPPERIRLVGHERLPDLGGATYIDDRPPVANGRVELLRYLREQSVSRTLHRFGNVVI